MVILNCTKNDYSKDLVAFDSIEDGKAFVAQILDTLWKQKMVLKWSILILKTYRIIWKLFLTEILFLYLNLCSILRKNVNII